MPYETPAQRISRLRAEALSHLEAAHALLDETPDGAACYLTGSAIDELRSHNWSSRDKNVIPLVPRPGQKPNDLRHDCGGLLEAAQGGDIERVSFIPLRAVVPPWLGTRPPTGRPRSESHLMP